MNYFMLYYNISFLLIENTRLKEENIELKYANQMQKVSHQLIDRWGKTMALDMIITMP